MWEGGRREDVHAFSCTTVVVQYFAATTTHYLILHAFVWMEIGEGGGCAEGDGGGGG